jgi:hypothetical protein
MENKMDSDFEDLYEELVDANQQDTQIVDEDNDANVMGDNDISKKREFVATVKGVSVEAIIEAKILHAIGDDEGLLQRLKQKRNILFLNSMMLQEAFEVVSGKKIMDLKKYATREIQADFIRYHKLLSES